MISLTRRGFELGPIPNANALVDAHASLDRWAFGQPTLLRQLCTTDIANQKQAILQTEKLVLNVLGGDDCDGLLTQAPYSERINAHFDLCGSVFDQGDEQEIETVLFDAIADGQVVAEDLWMKVSWLSFSEDDASLRFRFSFGTDLIEDVAADRSRQHYAALLSAAIFPESAIITENQQLKSTLATALGNREISFVERIIYVNAPNGGAYLHHDLERGHAGVVYAQLSGSTYWLALPKHQLLAEIMHFIQHAQWPLSFDPTLRMELEQLATEPESLTRELDSFANTALIHLINETQEFTQRLISHGHGYQVNAGDVLLLPQTDRENCCWHSVFCLGDEAGQALSFAIRAD